MLLRLPTMEVKHPKCSREGTAPAAACRSQARSALGLTVASQIAPVCTVSNLLWRCQTVPL